MCQAVPAPHLNLVLELEFSETADALRPRKGFDGFYHRKRPSPREPFRRCPCQGFCSNASRNRAGTCQTALGYLQGRSWVQTNAKEVVGIPEADEGAEQFCERPSHRNFVGGAAGGDAGDLRVHGGTRTPDCAPRAGFLLSDKVESKVTCQT